MKKHLVAVCSLLFAACSGSDEGEFVDSVELQPLGVSEQAFLSKVSTNYQWGVRNAQSRTQCNRTTSGQQCVIPSAKGGFFCLDSSLTAAEKTTARAVYTEIHNAIQAAGVSGPIWQEGPDPVLGSCQMFVSIGTVQGAAGNNIESYSNIDFGTLFDLTEGVESLDPVGDFIRHQHDFGFTDGFTTIDRTDINAKCSTTDGRTKLFRHALGHAIYAWHGLGSRTDAAVNDRYLRKTVATCGIALAGALTSGAACLIASAQYANNGDYSLIGGGPGGGPAVCSGD